MVGAAEQAVHQRDPIAPTEARCLPRQSDAASLSKLAKNRALVLLFAPVAFIMYSVDESVF
jgi:hypothetical protein